MKWFSEKDWRFIFVGIILIMAWTCSKVSNSNDSGASNHVDSLLLDAIKSSQQQDFDVALKKLQHTIDEAESINDYRNQVLGYINLGNLYLYYTADEEALNYFLTSLDLANKYKLDELLNTIYNNIGIIYSSNKDYQKAGAYFLKALKISQNRNEPKQIAINLINLGNLKDKEKDVDQAIVYFKQALELVQDQKDTVKISVLLNNIGNVSYQIKNYQEAKNYYQLALQLGKDNPANYFFPLFQLNYGMTLYQFEDYDSAQVFLQNALDSFLIIKNTDKIIESYIWLAKVSEGKGENKKAIDLYNESLIWKDTFLNEKSKEWISEMQMKYEFGKKEKEIEFLQQKSKQEKLIWGGSIFSVLIFSVMLFYYLRIKNTSLKQQNIILEKEQELANLEIAKNQLEQEKLKQKLELKNRELATKALHLVNKNEILNSVTNQLEQINVQEDPKNANIIRNAKNTIAHNINLDEQWEDFKIHFEEVHAGFFNSLTKDFPDLTQTDLRLSAYFLIDLNAKEIAQISNISPDSVRKRKQRLREKLNLNADQEIREILTQYERA